MSTMLRMAPAPVSPPVRTMLWEDSGGCTVRWLPVFAGEPTGHERARRMERMVKALRENRVDLSLFQRQRPQRRPEVLAALRTRILIVVEDRQAGKRLVQLLAAKGYEGVRVVRRAASALFLALQFSPGIVFLDVALTDDAYQLASDLRRQAGRRALRLIALTTSIEHSSREQARGAGFERWLVTPVLQNELDDLMCEEAVPARAPN